MRGIIKWMLLAILVLAVVAAFVAYKKQTETVKPKASSPIAQKSGP